MTAQRNLPTLLHRTSTLLEYFNKLGKIREVEVEVEGEVQFFTTSPKTRAALKAATDDVKEIQSDLKRRIDHNLKFTRSELVSVIAKLRLHHDTFKVSKMGLKEPEGGHMKTRLCALIVDFEGMRDALQRIMKGRINKSSGRIEKLKPGDKVSKQKRGFPKMRFLESAVALATAAGIAHPLGREALRQTFAAVAPKAVSVVGAILTSG